jgi:oxygen-dependent protoporphyrinogen oxidase
VGIVGGGIAGLVVAYHRMLAGDEVTLLESSGRLGGQLWTDNRSGFVVERGAEGFAPTSDAVRTLARELGIPHQIVGQQIHRSYGFDGRELAVLDRGEAPRRLGLRASTGPGGDGIASFRLGMGELVTALVNRIRGRVAVHLRDPVWQLAPSRASWELTTGSLGRVRVDSVVLATPARVGGELLTRVVGAATGLERAPALSSVTVSLAYPRASIGHELDGTGFVVAESASLEDCRACTFSSSKLPARSPDGYALLRLFFRPSSADLERMADRAWTERAQRVLRQTLQVKGDPRHGWVDRWPETLAVVTAEQRQRVAELEMRLAGRRLVLAGGAFHGPGIDGAVRSGQAAAAALDAALLAS